MRHLPQQLKVQGYTRVDDQGAQIQVSGAAYIIEILQGSFGAMDQETSIRRQDEWEQFARRPGETIDELLVRFDLVKHLYVQQQGHDVSAQSCAHKLLRL